jgi:excisionase family DNA binding protein
MTPKTVNVEEAGQILGIGRNSAYEAVRRGEIPVIKIGKLLRVPVVALERMLQEARPHRSYEVVERGVVEASRFKREAEQSRRVTTAPLEPYLRF